MIVYICEVDGCDDIFRKEEDTITVVNKPENVVRHFCSPRHLAEFYAERFNFIKRTIDTAYDTAQGFKDPY